MWNHHDKIQGLSADEAGERLLQFGPNELTSARRLTNLRQFLSFFSNPLVIILLIASVISAFVGEPVDAAIIALVVLLSARKRSLLLYAVRNRWAAATAR